VLLGRDPGVAVDAQAVRGLAASALERLARFHRETPLKAAMPREELRRQVFEKTAPGAFEHVLDELAHESAIRSSADSVALAGHSVSLSADETRAREAFLAASLQAGLSGVEATQAPHVTGREPRLSERVVRLLIQEGLLVRVGEGRLVHAEHLARLKLQVRERWPPGTHLDVGGFKDLTGLTRKFVIPLLEYLDRERVTRRSGADRLVLSAAAPAPL
jgi:selenocysteine-specific elongation factor